MACPRSHDWTEDQLRLSHNLSDFKSPILLLLSKEFPLNIFLLKDREWPGVVIRTCNPSILEGQGGRITWGQEFETRLANMMKLRLY